ncbi:UNVERIFIED_CONTAM: hypothetical protein FKN15_004983 [Acipenser sinensis]
MTLQTEPQPVFEGDTLILRCLVRYGYTPDSIDVYKDNTVFQSQAGKAMRVDRVPKGHEGSYKCRAWWRSVYFVDSAEVWVSVRELFSKPTLTLTPVSPVWEGEAVTLQCGAQINKQGTQLQYRYSKEGTDLRGAGSQDQHWIPAAGLRDTGRYQCEGEAAGTGLKKRSDPVSLTVREGWPKPALSRDSPRREIFEGDAVTLSCGVEGGSGGWRYLWYKDSESSPPVYQTDSSSGTGAGYTISAAALSHSGEYWCGAERNRTSLNSQYSHPIWVNVTALFSRVTLSVSPGATVKEGEALNLTCEAAVNKTPRPELHYTIVRDGEPVTNSTDSALYSIASTEKSHTGSYTCAVESQGVRKSSQELHIEVQRKPRIRIRSSQQRGLSSPAVQQTGVELE